MRIVFTSIRNLWRRLRGYRAGLRLLRDPSRLDAVFQIDDAIPDHDAVLARIVESMRAHPGPAEALVRRARLDVDLPALRAMADGTFGRAVARFLDDNGLDPRSIPTLDDGGGEAAWAKAHLYETHDVWHVATGFGTDEAGSSGCRPSTPRSCPGGCPRCSSQAACCRRPSGARTTSAGASQRSRAAGRPARARSRSSACGGT
jgi:hypothetical protein